MDLSKMGMGIYLSGLVGSVSTFKTKKNKTMTAFVVFDSEESRKVLTYEEGIASGSKYTGRVSPFLSQNNNNVSVITFFELKRLL